MKMNVLIDFQYEVDVAIFGALYYKHDHIRHTPYCYSTYMHSVNQSVSTVHFRHQTASKAKVLWWFVHFCTPLQ